ncbi:MAG: malto-oligosyltrehalose synthase [Desulfobacterales bacterium]|jgi:(1->4)-alpha-D-glucan 1-alpha-D-glucosylmutase
MNIPTATYRLQFSPQFGFQDAAHIAPYLADLGISHIYASPIFKARKGSPHGYDGVDPNQLNAELGTGADFKALHRKLAQNKIRWIQDIVPNHMAFDSANRMLMDVLQNGSFSRYYSFFDIEWDQPQKATHGRLMAPFLGDRFARCLQNGELKLSFDDFGFAVNYYQLKLPLKMKSYAGLLKPIDAKLRINLGNEHADYAAFKSVIKRLDNLSVSKRVENHREEVERIKRHLKDLYHANAVIRRCFEELVQVYNTGVKKRGRRDDLGKLLSEQVFRLCYWKAANEEINYRRFFDINELICLRQEKRDVFDTTHRLIKTLVGDGAVSGVRIDHVDGLADPAKYLRRLRSHLGDIFILVEKILQPEESMPASWPVQGSTGYDFTFRVNSLFCVAKNGPKFERIYRAFSGQTAGFDQMVNGCKRQVLKNQLGGDLNNLVKQIKQLAGQAAGEGDMSFQRLRQSLTEILARFPVYRTYIDRKGPTVTDRLCIQKAVAWAMDARPELAPALTYIRDLLLEKVCTPPGKDNPGKAEAAEKIIVKFQQLTAPLMAKGFEDTALYVYNRLVSLNEVGGDPQRFGCSANDFHAFINHRADCWLHSMNSTATHDSKRGEDVRARINVLSELPGEWENHLRSWHTLNRKNKMRVDDEEVPDQNEEYMLYQTLLGACSPEGPSDTSFVGRISQYLVKGVREGKIHSSWTEVSAEYEAALVSFAQKILHPVEGAPFLETFLPFFKKVAFYGIWNTLSQTLLKITAPGVPDFYQGTELFDFHLVDPDNRRPVDFLKRKQFLAEILKDFSSDPIGLIRRLLAHRNDGRIKLFLIARALQTRNAQATLFQQGTYVPLAVTGRFKAHVIAFARAHKNHCSIIAVPRFLTGLVKENQHPLGDRVWQDTEIILGEKAGSRWQNIFTAETLSAASSLKIGTILQHFPCALLLREDIE